MDNQKYDHIDQNEIAARLVDKTFSINDVQKELIMNNVTLRTLYLTIQKVTYHWLTIPFPEYDVFKPIEHQEALQSYANGCVNFNNPLRTEIKQALTLFNNLDEVSNQLDRIDSMKRA